MYKLLKEVAVSCKFVASGDVKNFHCGLYLMGLEGRESLSGRLFRGEAPARVVCRHCLQILTIETITI